MTFEEAIIKSIKKYYEGTDPVELNTASGKKPKYTREYFDELEEELLNPPKKKRKKKKELADESI